MNVTLPDGTVIQDVPDGMSKADLTAKLKANGYDTSKLDAPAKSEGVAATAGSLAAKVLQGSFNASMGVLRGAKDVVDTGALGLATVYDKVTESDKPTLGSLVTGSPQGEAARVRAMNDAGKADFKRDYGDSVATSVGRVAGNVAATLPVGGTLANVAGAIPGVARAVPGLLQAVRTGGFSGGNLLTKIAGGGVTGGASAGLVNPDDATTGAVIGASLPGGLRLAGAAGQAVGRVIRGPEQAADMAAAVSAARGSGYVIPPTQANPSLLNRVLEGSAGKLTTAQNASARNQAVTNAKVAKELGLPAGSKITPEALGDIRAKAGTAYEAVASQGSIRLQPSYDAALDKIVDPYLNAAKGFPGAKVNPIVNEIESLRTPIADADSAVAKIKELRAKADDAYNAGNKDLGKALKGGAKALEDAIDAHLVLTGAPADLLKNFRESRTLIAKTYSVEKALNRETGSVDARKLASQLQRGKPLSGELEKAAAFAARFPKAAQVPEGMGSLPGTSPLDWLAASGMSAAMSNPLMMLSVGARPAARAAVLSPVVQNRLLQVAQTEPSAIRNRLLQLSVRGAPVLAADR